MCQFFLKAAASARELTLLGAFGAKTGRTPSTLAGKIWGTTQKIAENRVFTAVVTRLVQCASVASV